MPKHRLIKKLLVVLLFLYFSALKLNLLLFVVVMLLYLNNYILSRSTYTRACSVIYYKISKSSAKIQKISELRKHFCKKVIFFLKLRHRESKIRGKKENSNTEKLYFSNYGRKKNYIENNTTSD